MANDWKTLRVDDIKAAGNRAIAIGPFGSRMKSEAYVAVGVPVIRGNNISDTRSLAGDFVFVSEETADELRASNVFAGDLVFPHRGAIGEVAIVPDDGVPRYMLSTSLMKLTCNPDRVDPNFVFYFFRSEHGRHALLQNASTVGTPGIGQPLTSLRSIVLPVPPLSDQRAIAHILGTLDDKIDLNRRMSDTLALMARALFKSWFVDFDPVRAKTEGRDAALPKPLADLFPVGFVNSELGEIPEGWTVGTIGTVADVIDCLHSKKPERRHSGLPLLQLVNIRDDGVLDMSDTYCIDEADYRNWIARMEASPSDCVITNVGRVGAVSQIPTGQKAALGRNMTGVRCRRDFPFPTVMIEALLSHAMKAEIALKIDSGTILDALNVRNIPRLRFVRGTPAVLAQFERLCRPWRSRMEGLLAESRELAALRDALLPKFISGMLRVPSRERIGAES